MFQKIPWQVFSTHKVTRPMGVDRQRALFPEYFDAVRDAHRDTIGLLWSAEEVRAQNVRYRTAPNFHCLWISNKPLSEDLLRSEWLKRAGTSGKLFDIQPCDGNPSVIEYLLVRLPIIPTVIGSSIPVSLSFVPARLTCPLHRRGGGSDDISPGLRSSAGKASPAVPGRVCLVGFQPGFLAMSFRLV